MPILVTWLCLSLFPSFRPESLPIYQLKSEGYDRTSRSVLLPDLDLELLGRCLQMSEEKEALKLFRNAVRAG